MIHSHNSSCFIGAGATPPQLSQNLEGDMFAVMERAEAINEATGLEPEAAIAQARRELGIRDHPTHAATSARSPASPTSTLISATQAQPGAPVAGHDDGTSAVSLAARTHAPVDVQPAHGEKKQQLTPSGRQQAGDRVAIGAPRRQNAAGGLRRGFFDRPAKQAQSKRQSQDSQLPATSSDSMQNKQKLPSDLSSAMQPRADLPAAENAGAARHDPFMGGVLERQGSTQPQEHTASPGPAASSHLHGTDSAERNLSHKQPARPVSRFKALRLQKH